MLSDHLTVTTEVGFRMRVCKCVCFCIRFEFFQCLPRESILFIRMFMVLFFPKHCLECRNPAVCVVKQPKFCWCFSFHTQIQLNCFLSRYWTVFIGWTGPGGTAWQALRSVRFFPTLRNSADHMTTPAIVSQAALPLFQSSSFFNGSLLCAWVQTLKEADWSPDAEANTEGFEWKFAKCSRENVRHDQSFTVFSDLLHIKLPHHLPTWTCWVFFFFPTLDQLWRCGAVWAWPMSMLFIFRGACEPLCYT